jgi:hypothetical protein
MNHRDSMAIAAFVALAMAGSAAAQAPQVQATGNAIVRVETDPPGASGTFTFTGVPSGSTTAGGSLSANDLTPGSYTTTGPDAVSGFLLASIACDDSTSETPSHGEVPTRTATFEIDRGETVTCVFLYRKGEISEESAASPGGPGSEPLDPGDAGGCVAPAMVPKAGTWTVANFAGRMVCGSMINMPLTPSQESGTLSIRDCGWTVVGTGMAEGTAALTMRAVDKSGAVYTGAVGGVQDGIPMTIEFTWNLNSDEWIVGDLKSTVTQQGMTCNMSRPFELKYTGG